MRVISGQSRGRHFKAPPGDLTRPTSDRVREAVFSMLGHLIDLEGSSVVDLFSGSGGLGLEALSRGASSVVFVEQDRLAVDTINSNLTATGLDGGDGVGASLVVRADVLAWLAAQRVLRFDLALIDPPYVFSQWAAVLSRLPAALAIAESDRHLADELASVVGSNGAPTWEILKERQHGTTIVTVARRIDATAASCRSRKARRDNRTVPGIF